MNEFTFLGRGNNALSMFIEILVSKFGKDFSIEIVQNIEGEDETPYLPDGIIQKILWHEDYDFSCKRNYIIGVNKPLAKKAVYNFFLNNGSVETEDYLQLIHPNAILSSTTALGNGIILNPGVITAPYVRLSDLVTVNRKVSIGHHTTIDDFSTIHPGVNIAGHCKIGKCVTIGMGANIIDGISVGDYAVIGAGSLVTKDVAPETTVYGVPAKVKE